MTDIFKDPGMVSMGNLSIVEIAEARSADKLTVVEGGYGFVPKDWIQSLRNRKDEQEKLMAMKHDPEEWTQERFEKNPDAMFLINKNVFIMLEGQPTHGGGRHFKTRGEDWCIYLRVTPNEGVTDDGKLMRDIAGSPQFFWTCSVDGLYKYVATNPLEAIEGLMRRYADLVGQGGSVKYEGHLLRLLKFLKGRASK